MLWKKLPFNLKILTLSMILANIGGRIFRPFLSLYIIALGGTVVQVGIFFTIDTIVTALMRPFGGWLSDTIGRLQAVGIGTVFGLIGFVGYAISPTWQWLILFTFAMAGGRSLVGPSFRAFTAEASPEGRVGETFGLVNGLFRIVDIIGPLLGGWLVLQFGLLNIIWFGVAFFSLATALRLAVARKQTYIWSDVRISELKVSFKGIWLGLTAGGLLTWLFINDSIFDFGNQLYENLRSLLLDVNGYNEGQIGLMFSLMAIVYTTVSFFGSRLADKYNPILIVIIGDLFRAAALVVMFGFQEPAIFPLYFILAGLGFGIAEPAFDVVLVRAAPKGQLGLTFGLFRSIASFLAMPAPYLGSLLWEQFSPYLPFGVGLIFLVIAMFFTWFVLGPLYQKAVQSGQEAEPAV